MSVTMIGNAHIDPVWLWQWREGYHEVKATFRSALDRMKEYDNFVFTCACACYYQWVEESDPDMFEEIRTRVREGRWKIAGGMWIQPDMNAPGGESFARQLLYSQRYFMEKFGQAATFGYNVDSFGHNAMMPQIYKKAGIDAYVWMRPGVHENPEIPEGSMVWESPDGSRIQTHRIFGEYTAHRDVPRKLDEIIFPFSDRIGQDVMCFYGVGNHGGGPTIANLNEITAYMKEAPRGGEIAFGSPGEFFDRLDAAKLPVWKNELQHHASGCYSTHALSKRLHRRAENALMRMEAFTTMAGETPDKAAVMQAWKNLMFNQFHDIMGGCSLPEAMEDVCTQLSETVSIAAREENKALQKLSWRIDTAKGLPPVRSKEYDWKLWGNDRLGTPIVVFNPHPYEMTDTVCVRRPLKALTDDAGRALPVQITRASRTNGMDKYDAVFRATVPPMGWKLYWAYLEEKSPVESALTASETALENAFLRAEFDPETGALIHLIDKKSGTDALTAPASLRLMDISASDTWAHMIFKFDREAGAFGQAEVRLLECGPVRASLRVRMRHGDSRLQIIYRLNADSDQLDAELRIEMRDEQRMLKWCFPTGGDRETAEIPFGALTRRGNGDEEHCQRWVALGNLLVMNDGRYSYSADKGELRMTLAHTSIYADHYGQAQRDDECLYMDMEPLTLKMALKPFGGSLTDAHPERRAAVLNRPFCWIEETYHKGDLPAEHSCFIWDAENAALEAFKRAEDGKGHIVRVRDTAGKAQRVRIGTLGRSFTADLGAWEFKTFYLPDDPEQPVRETLLTELD